LPLLSLLKKKIIKKTRRIFDIGLSFTSCIIFARVNQIKLLDIKALFIVFELSFQSQNCHSDCNIVIPSLEIVIPTEVEAKWRNPDPSTPLRMTFIPLRMILTLLRITAKLGMTYS
jgi:hypothetical protein